MWCAHTHTHTHTMEYYREFAQYSVVTLWSPEGMMGEGIVRESGMDMDTLLDLTRRTSKDLLSSIGNTGQYSVITL